MDNVKWIKIATGLPDNRKIKQIRKLPDGDTIALMWVFLMCLAGETNADGMVYFTPEIPYTDEMLAGQFDMDINTVRLGLNTFQRFGMIEVIDNIICLGSWERWQSVEGLEKIREQNRLRQKRKREKHKTLLIGEGNTCEYCGKPGSTVDHIIALTKGGYDIPENTVCACLECNMQKTNRDVATFLNEKLSEDKMFDVNRILANEKIMKAVLFDGKRFLSRDVTGQVTQCHAIDKEEDIDIDRDIDIDTEKDIEKKKSKKEKSEELLESLLPQHNLSPVVKDKVRKWIKYKAERNDHYKETGLSTLLDRIENRCLRYGDKAVCELIDDSISSGWSGIIFDRLESKNNQTQTRIANDPNAKRPKYKKLE